jgi:hypothetical protein
MACDHPGFCLFINHIKFYNKVPTMNWIKYSGIWIGIVLNPFHWRLGFVSGADVWNDPVFENCLHLGPVWIRVIIDDGRW